MNTTSYLDTKTTEAEIFAHLLTLDRPDLCNIQQRLQEPRTAMRALMRGLLVTYCATGHKKAATDSSSDPIVRLREFFYSCPGIHRQMTRHIASFCVTEKTQYVESTCSKLLAKIKHVAYNSTEHNRGAYNYTENNKGEISKLIQTESEGNIFDLTTSSRSFCVFSTPPCSPEYAYLYLRSFIEPPKGDTPYKSLKPYLNPNGWNVVYLRNNHWVYDTPANEKKLLLDAVDYMYICDCV